MRLLNDDCTLVGELFKVGLEGQVVVRRLDVGWQHFAGLRNIHARVDVCAKVLAHISAVGAVSDRDERGVSRGIGSASRGRVCEACWVGGVNLRGAGRRMQQAAARVREQNGTRSSSNALG
jgi:hypothetical protein